jgi:hypothetical protein
MFTSSSHISISFPCFMNCLSMSIFYILLTLLKFIQSEGLSFISAMGVAIEHKLLRRNSTFLGDSQIYPPSLLETSMLNRSDVSFDGMFRGNGASLGESQSGESSQKYSCAKCGRNYLHQVFAQIIKLKR